MPPRFRPDLAAIAPYTPGKRIDEVARPGDAAAVAKLSSNECPWPPFPEVVAAIAAAADGVHRYPDNAAGRLREALGAHVGVNPDRVMVGTGSNTLLLYAALAVGGPGTSTVYADPGFALYPIAARVAGAEPIAVPLDGDLRHDLAAMGEAVRDDTTLVFVCNPNNPTGTHVAAAALEEFVAALPPEVLVVVDEAYGEYATAPDYASAVPLTMERDNVLVTRTFSKVYGLAGLRLGYAVADPVILEHLYRTAIPFAASTPAQAGALEALRHQDRIRDRVARTAAGRAALSEALDIRSIRRTASEANFVYFAAPDEWHGAFLERGVITRRYRAGWLRVTIGTEAENARFLAALDALAPPP